MEITKYKSVNKNTLVAFVDVYVPKMGLEFYGCMYHKKDNREWINFPSKEFINAEGEKKFLGLCRFKERSHQDAFSKQVIDAIKTYVASNHENDFPEMDEEAPF